MKLTFLGTGTSTGIPQLQCDCPVCHSTDPADNRLRCSALLEINSKHILIDCGPDFRQQMLRYHRNGNLDALFITHYHYDHVGGTDDLRPYCNHNRKFPILCQASSAEDLYRRMPYCFTEHPYPGVPQYDVNIIEAFKPFTFEGIEVMPLAVNHYLLDIVGYKIGDLAYITDAKVIPQQTIDLCKGIDTLVINALRKTEHISHLSLEQSLTIIKEISPRRTYLTHLSHDMGFAADLVPILPDGVFVAHDGLTIEC